MIADLADMADMADANIAACYAQAARRFNLPSLLLPAIRLVEGGQPGMVKPNTNGTHDLGAFQINTTWLRHFAPYGITEAMLRNDVCISAHVAGWIVRYETNRAGGDLWAGIARYHSRNPKHQKAYSRKVWHAVHKIAAHLDASGPFSVAYIHILKNSTKDG